MNVVGPTMYIFFSEICRPTNKLADICTAYYIIIIVLVTDDMLLDFGEIACNKYPLLLLLVLFTED